jgi:hypothetical protein
MNKLRIITIIFALIFFSNIFLIQNTNACKDIIAVGEATEGDYNLLLKVRDPSRPGLQVLCIVPKDYQYNYRYPWTGKSFKSTVLHKFIGIATKDDVIPNVVKAGMVLSDAGIAYGDADSGSRWVNPTKNAWDDFDWIRYACEKASSEDEAVTLLTVDAVKKLHATGVSENLFVVGPKKAVVIEADAFRYKINEFENGIYVMSNYPKELWKSQVLRCLPIARSFDTTAEKAVRKGQTVRLKSIHGIRITGISDDSITVKPVPFINALLTKSIGIVHEIKIGERKTVGQFSVELLEIQGNKAKISVCYKFKAWEDEMLNIIAPRYGSINVQDMIFFSRLHKEDLKDLRPMCEDLYQYEAVAIYKIPSKNYETLSMGWFSPNHACSSIYVPFHICNNDIYEPYKTGEAAEICLELLTIYGHGFLNESFSKTETVFLNEIDLAENLIINDIISKQKIDDFLTIIDIGMQRQAFLTEKIWIELAKLTKNKEKIQEIIKEIWSENYFSSLKSMKNSIDILTDFDDSNLIKNYILEITLDICKTRLDAVEALDKSCHDAIENYNIAKSKINIKDYEQGFMHLEKSYLQCEQIIKGQLTNDLDLNGIQKNEKIDAFYIFLIIFFVIIIITAIAFRPKKP